MYANMELYKIKKKFSDNNWTTPEQTKIKMQRHKIQHATISPNPHVYHEIKL